tara:strand:+ start:120 stop:284 length:165 start_codon:yes stop_codon:yes gene_type:complete
MKVETNELQTAGNFAKEKDVTTVSVYRWLKMGVIKGIEIDGVKFVKTEKVKPTK